MRAKQCWEIRIVAIETEGDSTTTRPWYSPSDIVALIRQVLNDGHATHCRDLQITAINASPDGKPYY